MASSNDRVRQVVLNAARDASPQVRAASLKSLARLDLRSEDVLPTLKENFGMRMKTSAGRWSICSEAARVAASGRPELDSLLTAENADVAQVAAILLGKVGPQAARRLIERSAARTLASIRLRPALAEIGRPLVALSMNARQRP